MPRWFVMLTFLAMLIASLLIGKCVIDRCNDRGGHFVNGRCDR